MAEIGSCRICSDSPSGAPRPHESEIAEPALWIVAQGIETALINSGKAWQSGSAERFNGKFLDECLSLEWVRSRAEAKVVIGT
jgi:hypothetical protein